MLEQNKFMLIMVSEIALLCLLKKLKNQFEAADL